MWMLFNRCIFKIVAAVSLDVIEEHTMMTTIPTSHILKNQSLARHKDFLN